MGEVTWEQVTSYSRGRFPCRRRAPRSPRARRAAALSRSRGFCSITVALGKGPGEGSAPSQTFGPRLLTVLIPGHCHVSTATDGSPPLAHGPQGAASAQAPGPHTRVQSHLLLLPDPVQEATLLPRPALPSPSLNAASETDTEWGPAGTRARRPRFKASPAMVGVRARVPPCPWFLCLGGLGRDAGVSEVFTTAPDGSKHLTKAINVLV